MAKVRFAGATINADVLEQKATGSYLMRARDHSARTSPGTLIIVSPQEVLEMSSAEMPANAPLPADLTIGPVPASKINLDQLEAAMATERETLPTPAQLIAQHREATEVKTPPGRPTQAPSSTGQ